MRSGWSLVLLLSALCAHAQTAPPFIRSKTGEKTETTSDDHHHFWANRRVTFEFNRAGSAKTPIDTEFTALKRAMASWNKASAECSDLYLEVSGFSDERRVGESIPTADGDKSVDGRNLVLFREERCVDEVTDCWEGKPETLAVTLTNASKLTGQIKDADIIFNAADHLFTTIDAPLCDSPSTNCVAEDVESIMVHELGHAVGLAHSEAPNSVMDTFKPPGLLARTIDPGTAAGLCFIYPRGRPSPIEADDLDVRRQRILAEAVRPALGGCAAAGTGGTAGVLLVWAFLLWTRRGLVNLSARRR